MQTQVVVHHVFMHCGRCFVQWLAAFCIAKDHLLRCKRRQMAWQEAVERSVTAVLTHRERRPFAAEMPLKGTPKGAFRCPESMFTALCFSILCVFVVVFTVSKSNVPGCLCLTNESAISHGRSANFVSPSVPEVTF